GILQTGGDGSQWRSMGWKFMRTSIIAFAVLAFLGSSAAIIGGGGMRFNGTLVTGWDGVWWVTLGGAAVGFLFGLIGLLIFKTLAMASKG
ncbi:MAG: hypothetical protein AAGG69_12260, partial [Pseudomonadota bacterium]